VTSNQDFPKPNADPSDSRAGGWDSVQEFSGIGSRVFFLACVCAVVIASLIGAPHIFYSYHVSHFAVLYVLALATLAAFPGWGVLKTFWRLLFFVSALGLARLVMHHHVETSFLDWISDLSGVLGGLAPIAVQRLREIQLGSR
jgi:hypothetical protein